MEFCTQYTPNPRLNPNIQWTNLFYISIANNILKKHYMWNGPSRFVQLSCRILSFWFSRTLDETHHSFHNIREEELARTASVQKSVRFVLIWLVVQLSTPLRGYFPSKLNLAIVMSMYKTEVEKFMGNFRPVSNHLTIAKYWEKLLTAAYRLPYRITEFITLTYMAWTLRKSHSREIHIEYACIT